MQSKNSYVIVRQSIEILFLTILIIYSCRKIVLLFHYENILKAGDSDLTHSRCYLHCIYSLNSTNWVYVLSVSSAVNKGGAKFMGNVAVAMQEYLGNVERFADLFNGVFFHGEQVLAPEQLCEQSERYAVKQKVFPEEHRKGKRKPPYKVKRKEEFRDVKKKLQNGTMFRILAIKSQNYVDYIMPLRCMEYDVQEYLKQVRILKHKYEQTKELHGDERLSGVKKHDRLIPVYTLCLYHGEKPWDGPVKLSDLMEFGADEDDMSAQFADYPMRLYCINSEDNFEQFHTDIKEVFQAFRYRDDKEKLKALMLEDPAYQSLPGDTVEIITELLNLEELAEESIKHMEKDENGREHYNMCKAWIEIKEEEQKIGRERGDNNRTRIVVSNMLRRGYSTEDICAIAECSEQLVNELRESLSE